MKPLFIPLKTEFYKLFEAGRKKAELRKYGPRWNEKTCEIGRPVILSKGYGKKFRIAGKIIDFKKKPAREFDDESCGMNIYPATTATTGTQKNFTLADLQSAKELIEALPPVPKSITFNDLGLIKFRHAAKIDAQMLNDDSGFTWEGVRCFLVPDQFEEYKINY